MVRADAGDRQRQQIRAQADRLAGAWLACLCQYVVVAGTGSADHCLLVGGNRVAGRRVEVVAAGRVGESKVQLVVAGVACGIETDPQAFPRSDGDPVEGRPVGNEGRRQRPAELQFGNADLQGGARRPVVVGFAWRQGEAAGGVAAAALEDLVVQVGADDDPPVAVPHRRQAGGQRGGVGGTAGQIAAVGELADQEVAGIPVAVGREIEGVRPVAACRVDRVVEHRKLDADRFAHLGSGRQQHAARLEVRGWWRFDEDWLWRSASVVVFVAGLAQLATVAAAPDACRITDDEEVVCAGKMGRDSEGLPRIVVVTRRQSMVVDAVAEVVILVEVEEAIPGKVDEVVPGRLAAGSVTAAVGNPPVHEEGLSGEHARRRADFSHLQVGRDAGCDRQGGRRLVVALVAEFTYQARTVADDHQPGQSLADRAPLPAVAVDRGVGANDEVEVAAERVGQLEGRRGAVGFARAQELRSSIRAEADALRGRPAWGTVCEQREVSLVERGVARQIEAIEPGAGSRFPAAPVADLPTDGQRATGSDTRRREADAIDLQVGLAIGDHQLAAAAVVVVRGSFMDREWVILVTRAAVVPAVVQLAAHPLRIPGSTVGVGVGDDVDVVPAIAACRQADRRRVAVAAAAAEAAAVGADEAAEKERPVRVEDRVATEVDGVDPGTRSRPDVGAEVADRPADPCLLAGEGNRLGAHLGDAQVGGLAADLRCAGAAVVQLVRFGDPVAAVGAHDEEAARHRGCQQQRLADGVCLTVGERPARAVVAEVPHRTREVPVRVVGEVDRIDPVATEALTAVGDAVAVAVAAAGSRRVRRHDITENEIGRCRTKDADRPRAMVVAVDLLRIVGVDLACQRVLEDQVVGVAPDADVVLPRRQAIRKNDLDAAAIVLAGIELADVLEGAEQDVALEGAGAALVTCQPDAVGPALGGVGFATRACAAEIGDAVADLDAGAVHTLAGGHDLCGDQVGKGQRVDGERDGKDVVGFVRVLVDFTVAVGDDDQEGVAAQAQRDVDGGRRTGVELARCECTRADDLADQSVIAAEGGVEREIDLVGPPAAGRGTAEVAGRVADRRRAAGRDVPGDLDPRQPQVWSLPQADVEQPGGLRRVVAGGAAVLVEAAALRARRGVAHHLQAMQPFTAGWQAKLLAAGVALSGSQSAVVIETAQLDRRAAARRQKPERVAPASRCGRQTLVEDRPRDVDPFTLDG